MDEVKAVGSKVNTGDMIISNEWKHSLEVNPQKSVTSLVSLYDLFYDSEDNKLWAQSEKRDSAGIKLDHDIILFNKEIRDSNGDMLIDNLESSSWYRNGIDISLPFYDTRAKQLKVPYSGKIGNKYIFKDPEGYYLYDKDSATAPLNKKDFMRRGVLVADNITEAQINKENFTPPIIDSSDGEFFEKASIILTSKDLAFSSIMSDMGNNEAYNRMFLNIDTSFSAYLLVKALGINVDLFSNSVKGPVDDGVAQNVKFSDDDFGILKSIINTLTLEDRWFTILKNTFVWVRASFFGDYVVPDSFNQNLTRGSDVIHKEFMVSGAADFKKYDTYNSKEINPSEESMPYVPLTSPTVDFYTSKFLDDNFKDNPVKEKTTEGNYSSKLKPESASTLSKFLDKEEFVNNPIIKGLPIATVIRQSDSGKDDKSIAPPTYFDTEVRNYTEYFRDLGKFPTILPPDGNIYVDGRIISPTIDEIWYMLKKLVGGRASDIDNSSSITEPANNSRAKKIDIGFPFGNDETCKNESDTTMTEVRDSEFNFRMEDATTKKGDPIGYEYKKTDTGEITNLFITRFVNQNDSIVYPVYKLLKKISEKVTTFNEGKERDITNFTAWDLGTWGDEIDDDKVINDNATVTKGVWKPREVPYSLRELEAIGLSNKYNIVTLARFIQNNFSIVGGLGKKIESIENPENNIAGSLYQFHKNYNYSIDNPNSYFSNNGSKSGFSEDGNPIGINVPSSEQVDEATGLIPHDTYYEGSINLKSNEYLSSEVYLAADGTWRYINDHIRIPVLKCEY